MVKNTGKNTFFDHFGQGKPTKFGDWLVVSTLKRIFEFAQIERGCSVLEIGPGRGVFADICLSNGVGYWAIEPNEKMADKLEERGVNVVRSIVPPLPEMGRTFDIVVMNNVLEHMDTMTVALRLAKEVYELLNAGGRFVIYSPDYVNFQYLFFQSDFSHNYVTTWRRMEGLLISAGFENIKARYQSGHFTGAMCFLVSGIASWLPFGRLNALFPENELLRKLYKLQTPFLRRVLMFGEKHG